MKIHKDTIRIGLLLNEQVTHEVYVHERTRDYKTCARNHINSVIRPAIAKPVPKEDCAKYPADIYESEAARMAHVELMINSQLQDGAEKIRLEPSSAGCSPIIPDCTDEDQCPWNSNRVYKMYRGAGEAPEGGTPWKADVVTDLYREHVRGTAAGVLSSRVVAGLSAMDIVVFHELVLQPSNNEATGDGSQYEATFTLPSQRAPAQPEASPASDPITTTEPK